MNQPVQFDTNDLNLSHNSDKVNHVLDNLEQMHPQYLAKLLRNGDLSKVIRRRVDWYQRTMARLQKELPNEPYETLDARARDCLGGTNLNWQDEQHLTKEEENLLREFRKEHHI